MRYKNNESSLLKAFSSKGFSSYWLCLSPQTQKTQVTHQQVLLRRGQMGTVLISFDNNAFLIDFTDQKGNTFAMETIEPIKLLRLN